MEGHECTNGRKMEGNAYINERKMTWTESAFFIGHWFQPEKSMAYFFQMLI
jgi:hypothetical protein